LRLVGETIAGAFESGLSWRGSLAVNESLLSGARLERATDHEALDQFLEENPHLAEKPYGDVLVAWARVPGLRAVLRLRFDG
jgi:hypothetical protein